MTPQHRWRLVLVGEGPSDRDRLLPFIRHRAEQCGVEVEPEPFGSEDYLKIGHIQKRHGDAGFPSPVRSASGFRKEGDTRGDRRNLRWLFQLLTKQFPRASGSLLVIWSRDTDGDDDCNRKDAFTEVRREFRERFPHVAGAIADECGEAWEIAGYAPLAAEIEPKILQRWKKELRFDPLAEPERLSHKEHDPKSAKKILNELKELLPGQDDRWVEHSADPHARNIQKCGLRDFSEHLKEVLTPPKA